MSKAENAPKEIELEQGEEQQVHEKEELRSPVIYEIIRREGEVELGRPAFSLAVSGLIAGLAIGFSVLGESVLHAYLPNAPWRHLVESLGYCFGFLIVIYCRLQLFTENTITPVLTVFLKPSVVSVARTTRLWGIVLCANVTGCLLFALGLRTSGVLSADVLDAAMAISHHMMENSRWEMFAKGIFSGWLIASLVWMMPSAESAKFWVIVLVTYLIAAGNFTHVVAGSVEGFLLVLNSDISLFSMAMDFFIPTLIGNIVGGTALFALLSYGQVSEEI
jgi:formate/nitrite transporter FocA (FNT family)